MEFLTSPPEVTSALLHSGPGAESLVAAASAWQRLGADLEDTVRSYAPVLASLTEAWHGPSSAAMMEAVGPYMAWLRAAAQQCEQLSSAARQAVAAFGSTLSAVVPPSVVTDNRIELARLYATNRLGGNLAAIAETESQYETMWVNNSAAMYRYQAASAQALALPQFSSPPSITSSTGSAAQANVVPTPLTPSKPTTWAAILAALAAFDPNAGWFGLANTYANQFISSGFPINLLSYAAQNTSAQALQTVAPEIGEGLFEGESALGESVANLSSATRALGGLQAPTAALGAGVPMGNLTAPPAVVKLVATSQTPVQLASAASPLPAGEAGLPMPPMMPMPISAGSGWRKRKQQKYEDLAYGLEVNGTVMPRSPSAG
ncbi:PPE family protein [Mycobacterium sp.]|uniref:PPE family protein n=1 Tax=Mycobacterium sp. TaxID=1785 RepID=UPI003BAC3A14